MSELVTRLTSYGVLEKGGAVLLCRLSHQTANPGHWTLPGGGLEFGEHPEEALIREISEETGLKSRAPRFLDFQSEVELYRGKTFHVIRFFYRVTQFEGELRVEQDGTTDFCAWVDLASLSPIPTMPLVAFALHLSGLA